MADQMSDSSVRVQSVRQEHFIKSNVCSIKYAELFSLRVIRAFCASASPLASLNKPLSRCQFGLLAQPPTNKTANKHRPGPAARPAPNPRSVQTCMWERRTASCSHELSICCFCQELLMWSTLRPFMCVCYWSSLKKKEAPHGRENLCSFSQKKTCT